MSTSLRNRINKLKGKFMTASTYETLLDKHSIETKRYPRSIDKRLLIDTVIALQVKDCKGHRFGSKAQNFLGWASTTEYNLIGRAYNLIDDQISAGYMSIRPEPVDLSSLDITKAIPPYSLLCTIDQLGACSNKPLWVD